MKRIAIVLILALAITLPLMAGCGENVAVVLPSLTPSEAASVQALVATGYLRLTLQNVHVHDLLGNEAYNFGNVTIDLVEWLRSSGDYQVCTANLPAGLYKDLDFQLTQAAWGYDIDGDWDLTGWGLGTITLDIANSGTYQFNEGAGIPIHIATLPLSVGDDGTAEWVWAFNLGVALNFQTTTTCGQINSNTVFGFMWSN